MLYSFIMIFAAYAELPLRPVNLSVCGSTTLHLLDLHCSISFASMCLSLLT
jgi:hypothetical protein